MLFVVCSNDFINSYAKMVTMTLIKYREVGIDGLDSIQELWRMLRSHIKDNTSDFKEEFENISFQERKQTLIIKSNGGALRTDLAEDEKNEIIAYCVSTTGPDNVGEVDSIYVKEGYRSQGIGDQLMKRALRWMEENGTESKKIMVTVGNQEVLAFYQRYGFRPRSIIMEEAENQSY